MKLKDVRATVLDVLQDTESVLVHGSYIGVVLALENEGLVTAKLIDESGRFLVTRTTEPGAKGA